MANIIEENVRIEDLGNGTIRIHHRQLWADGDDMGGFLVIELGSAQWLAEEIQRAATTDDFARLEVVRGPDRIIVFVGGSEMQPFVHVQNHRDPATPYGKLYTLAMTVAPARALAAELRNVSTHPTPAAGVSG